MNCAANMCSTGAVRSFEQRSSCLKFVVWLMKGGGHFNLLRDSCYLLQQMIKSKALLSGEILKVSKLKITLVGMCEQVSPCAAA